MINSCNDTKGIIMAIRYNKLWKKLIDENMMKVDLRDRGRNYNKCTGETREE